MEEFSDEKTVILEGEYVRLEAVCPKYFKDIVTWRNNGAVRQFVIQPFLLTEELEAKWYAKYLQEPGHLMLVMVAKTGNIPFGTIGYIKRDNSQKLCVGTHHLIGKVEYRASLEYAEAVVLFHDYIFGELGLKQMFSHVMLTNLKTVGMLKKIGFKTSIPVRFPEYLQMDGKILSEYTLTAESYAKHRHLLMQIVSRMEDS